jgi:hypothetical protein
MTSRQALTAVCTFRVRDGREEECLELLGRHVPTLHRLGFAEADDHWIFRGTDGARKTFFIEIFSWKSEADSRAAAAHAEVQAIWKPMREACEDRLDRPAMEFTHVELLTSPGA